MLQKREKQSKETPPHCVPTRNAALRPPAGVIDNIQRYLLPVKSQQKRFFKARIFSTIGLPGIKIRRDLRAVTPFFASNTGGWASVAALTPCFCQFTLVGGEEISSLSAGSASRTPGKETTAIKLTFPIAASWLVKV